MKLNKKPESIHTHEGAKARRISAEAQLKRSVMSCMLWEREFYESGVTIADRIKQLIPEVNPGVAASTAIAARSHMKLRHVPLLIAREMARHPDHKQFVSSVLTQIIQRPDELCEFLAIYWAEKRQPLSAQVKKGLAGAFTKFSEYQLAKYDRGDIIKLRDVLFLSHPKPVDNDQAELWKRLIDGTMATPDTWEVSLSSGKDKRSTWMRLIEEGKLGALAMLRNLRNMQEVDVPRDVIKHGLNTMKTDRVLPFRFIAAARYAPNFEPELERAMYKCLTEKRKLSGTTVLLVDVSGSMGWEITSKSQMSRLDAACGLSILAREMCEDVIILTFSYDVVTVPNRRGFALRDAVVHSQPIGATYLGQAVRQVDATTEYDRLIVFTDEQSHDSVPAPKGRGYMVNVASAKNGVGYGAWHHVDGFSEAILDYIAEYEL